MAFRNVVKDFNVSKSCPHLCKEYKMAVVRRIKYPGDTSNDFNNWLNWKSEEQEYFIKLAGKFDTGCRYTHVR